MLTCIQGVGNYTILAVMKQLCVAHIHWFEVFSIWAHFEVKF